MEKNIFGLMPDMIINDEQAWTLNLGAWSGFQSRQGLYGVQDQKIASDGSIQVFIEGKEKDFVKIVTAAQIYTIRYIIANAEKIRDIILNRLLKEMPFFKEIYEDLIPKIHLIEDFKKYIGLSNLHIMDFEKDGFAYVGFEFGCEWDDEHGIGVMTHKDVIIAVGTADVAFSDF